MKKKATPIEGDTKGSNEQKFKELIEDKETFLTFIRLYAPDLMQKMQQAAILGWQAFETQKPEYMQVCLIATEFGFVTEAQYTGEANIFVNVDNTYKAKAWMPLPTFP